MRNARLNSLLPYKPDGVTDTTFLSVVADFILSRVTEDELGDSLGLDKAKTMKLISDCQLISRRTKQLKSK